MKHTRTAPAFAALAALALLVTGCRSVDEGPALPPDPNAQNEIRHRAQAGAHPAEKRARGRVQPAAQQAGPTH